MELASTGLLFWLVIVQFWGGGGCFGGCFVWVVLGCFFFSFSPSQHVGKTVGSSDMLCARRKSSLPNVISLLPLCWKDFCSLTCEYVKREQLNMQTDDGLKIASRQERSVGWRSSAGDTNMPRF